MDRITDTCEKIHKHGRFCRFSTFSVKTVNVSRSEIILFELILSHDKLETNQKISMFFSFILVSIFKKKVIRTKIIPIYLSAKINFKFFFPNKTEFIFSANPRLVKGNELWWVGFLFPKSQIVCIVRIHTKCYHSSCNQQRTRGSSTNCRLSVFIPKDPLYCLCRCYYLFI